MSRKQSPHALAPSTEQPQRREDIAQPPYQVGDPLPVRLTVTDMCRIFGVGRSQFHRLERHGKVRRFELQPQIGHKAWSGLRVARYLTSESFSIVVKRSA